MSRRLAFPKARLALALCVVTAYATVVYALAFGTPPLSFLIPFALVYAALINLGTYFLNLGVFLDVISRGPRGARGVALTFDDGPHPVHTRRVLDLLDEFGAKATFFVIGEKAAAHPDVIRTIAERGHDLGVHSYTHDRFLNMRNERRIARELADTARVLEASTGRRTSLFRPPVGFTSPRTTIAVRELAMDVIGWTARAYDGLGMTTPARIVERVAPALADGAIVLLHDAAERGDAQPASVDALRGLLEAMRARNLAGVGLSAWLPALAATGALRGPVAYSNHRVPLAAGAREGGAS